MSGLPSAPVIALPEKLIAILRSRLPSDVLTAADYDFERALRRIGSGWFLGKPFHSEVAELPNRDAGEIPERLDATPLASIPPHMMEALKLMGVEKWEAKPNAADEWRPRTFMTNDHDAELRRGYCGWLLTNPQFNVERLRLPFQPESAGEKLRRQQFCSKWFLRDIVGRLIPEPLAFQKSVITKRGAGFRGLTLHVPWPHLRSSAYELRELVSEQEESQVSHIKEWLDRKTGIGTETYSKLFDICLYRDHGLFQRYRQRRFNGFEKLLQEVFAEYWNLDLDRDSDVPKDAVSITGNETARKLSSRLKTATDAMNSLWVSTGRQESTEARP